MASKDFGLPAGLPGSGQPGYQRPGQQTLETSTQGADARGMSCGPPPGRWVSVWAASAATEAFRAEVPPAPVQPRAPLTMVDRACCCPTAACVRVVLPATAARRHETDLLLCAHHYRRSQAALAALGSQVFDRQGGLLASRPPLFTAEH